MNFVKMHGTGNDFIMIDNFDGSITLSQKQVQNLCDRHFGIGADGVILVEKGSNGADAFMNYYNADGSLAEMCGNGSRCTAHFMKEFKEFDHSLLKLETRAGMKRIVIEENGLFTVNMGQPELGPHSDFPETSQNIGGVTWEFVSMGNPHAVGFFERERAVDNVLLSLGAQIESNTALFPNKINVNFVYPIAQNHFGVKTFERGSGPTQACGTGASASFAWLLKWGKAEGAVKILVPGGRLTFQYNEMDEILMTGPSEIVFKGEVPLKKT